jgi:hypothetical protein
LTKLVSFPSLLDDFCTLGRAGRVRVKAAAPAAVKFPHSPWQRLPGRDDPNRQFVGMGTRARAVAGPFRATRNWLDDAKLMNRSERLAAALLADRSRESKRDDRIIACFVCGHGFVYKGRQGDLNGRFCSMRCQSWHDKGISETQPDTTSLRAHPGSLDS